MSSNKFAMRNPFGPRSSHALRHRRDLGERKEPRVEYQRSGFIIPTPDAPWVECTICDVSEGGLRVDAGSLAVPNIFAVSFTSGGEVLRLCRQVWRRGGLIGACFVSAQQLRGPAPTDGKAVA
jgi:hypothetical protein